MMEKWKEALTHWRKWTDYVSYARVALEGKYSDIVKLSKCWKPGITESIDGSGDAPLLKI